MYVSERFGLYRKKIELLTTRFLHLIKALDLAGQFSTLFKKFKTNGQKILTSPKAVTSNVKNIWA